MQRSSGSFAFIFPEFSFLISLLLFFGCYPFICSMLEKIARFKVLAPGWLLVITILFLLPGSALPKEDLFIPHFDKYVHFGFFAVLLFLWRFHFPGTLKFTGLLLLLAFVYGFGIELIQHYLVANRSFDMGDVMADMAGATVGLLFWTWRYTKK